MFDIYRDKILKYPLSDEEFNKINNVWEFIKVFDKQFIYITDYRKYLLKKIKKTYSIDEFFVYEGIVNKMFWNLRWLLFPFFINNYEGHNGIPNELLLCENIKFTDSNDLDKKIKNISLNDSYYRSFINKLIMVDEENKIIYNKKMEGSSHIFSKNFFNLYTITVLFNRKLYEKIVANPEITKKLKIELPYYYHQCDYGFPNMNYCVYSFNTNENKKERIKKMYYDYNDERFWFRLLCHI